MLREITDAVRQRAVAATQMNAQSSRSHVILTLKTQLLQSQLQSILTLVDLAGSERAARTCSSGIRLEEAKKINQSLSCLGKCINALSKQSQFIPFRDCALTKLLAESLTNNCRTSLIATVAPGQSNSQETLSTLTFAQTCVNVKTMPRVNQIESPVIQQQNPVCEYDDNVEQQILGKFGVDNGIGYVKCQCPRCGAGLIVLDGDADDVQPQSAMDQVDELLRLREENLQ